MKYFVDETEFTHDEFREYIGDDKSDIIQGYIVKALANGPISKVEYYPDTDIVIIRVFNNMLRQNTVQVFQKEDEPQY